MDVYELVEKLGGEICRGRARARIDGEIVVIGQLNGDYMEFTEAGRRLSQDAPKIAEEVVDTKPRRGRPAKAVVVESEPVVPSVDGLFDTPETGLT